MRGFLILYLWAQTFLPRKALCGNDSEITLDVNKVVRWLFEVLSSADFRKHVAFERVLLQTEELSKEENINICTMSPASSSFRTIDNSIENSEEIDHDLDTLEGFMDALESVEPEKHKVGLFNLGNTCYMNSILQALYMTSIFRNQIILFDNHKLPLFFKMQKLFALLQCSKKTAVSPNCLLTFSKTAGFVVGHQHDSSEFLLCLLDALHEQEEKDMEEQIDLTSWQDTIVERTFGGRSITAYSCGKCGKQNEIADYFRDISLCFPEENDINKKHSVSSLLDLYLQREELFGKNSYQCERCGLVDGQKTTRITDTPEVLIINIRHIRYDPVTYEGTKLLDGVKLDESLLVNEVFYDIYAVVVHCGADSDSGHYYCLAEEDGEWFEFNDSFVRKRSRTYVYELESPHTPYVVFYRSRKSEEPKSINFDDFSLRLQEVVLKDFLGKDKEEPKKSKKYKRSRGKTTDDLFPRISSPIKWGFTKSVPLYKLKAKNLWASNEI